ncbi:fad binding domain-containing protein [Diplodia corticola]|uniref:Fad binding domain-containing protein n=1 Tax=Diplodia corticola TaxID=236234 RepID=A0A1J9QMS1_9PEZI|nr:fad binding domain-containing protein [Diplodia corticola]OJD29370.1 fad binding domain-containing protein [Diplodia corticola]
MALNGLTQLNILDEGLVELGPGNLWEKACNALGGVGRYMIGGRMKSIGVPGLSSIGGVHWFSNKYGDAVDNVMSYDVVLGSGLQVVAYWHLSAAPLLMSQLTCQSRGAGRPVYAETGPMLVTKLMASSPVKNHVIQLKEVLFQKRQRKSSITALPPRSS